MPGQNTVDRTRRSMEDLPRWAACIAYKAECFSGTGTTTRSLYKTPPSNTK